MKTFVFDIMLNGRYICTLKHKYCSLFPLDFGDLIKFVLKKRPTLKGKDFKIVCLDMAGFEKGKKYDVVDAEHGDCVGCCFNKDGCTLDIDIPCREGFIYKEIKESDNERT